MQHSGVPTGSVIVSKLLQNRRKKGNGFSFLPHHKNPDPSKGEPPEDD